MRFRPDLTTPDCGIVHEEKKHMFDLSLEMLRVAEDAAIASDGDLASEGT